LKKPNKKAAEKHFGQFLTALGFDWKKDVHMQDTPNRVSKMYIEELFKGLFEDVPVVTRFKKVSTNNDTNLQNIIVGPIDVKSLCSHHFLPIRGEAYIGVFVSTDDLPGLSKYARLVNYYSRRPQVQERLTMQIAEHIVSLDLPDVAVLIKAQHYCTCHRGINDDAAMTTIDLRGKYRDTSLKQEFLSMVQLQKNG
jgi:GTP cyclohydrolase IA